MKVQRYDRAFIKDNDITETAEGYLNLIAPVTKPGVFPYRRGDGAMQMEAKLPEELFSDSMIESLNSKPFTDDHPHELVTAANYKKYAKGTTHNDAQVRDNKLFVSLTVTDADTIKKIKNGKRELSLGFSADLIEQRGTYDGVQYDSVQRNMRVNHLALVDQGRVGPDAAIRGDSAAFMIDSKDINNELGGNAMAKLVFDGKEIEVDPLVKANFETLESKLETATTRAASADKLEGERDSLKVQLDAKEKELADVKESALTEDKLDQAIAESIELRDSARVFLGDDYDFLGKTNREVKEAAIKTVNDSFKADGKSDDYVDAFFDSLKVTVKEDGFTSDANFNKGKPNAKEEAEIEKKKAARQNIGKKGDN
ncbi:DUF2213 domain-containing protein [Listeria booriae]|uniref:DUF2213 domain-containing protein n=1 Tax=Listeria booriae TaxID=1552123 RepID=UPI0016279689|nr:DUF2213 domain-containing protein [Listeria booriae]MBC2148098.1 DUF2213 domain-containing protein [Listeria booriae]